MRDHTEKDNPEIANAEIDHNRSDGIVAIDPRLNCAAKICCPPSRARNAQIELLCEAGCPDDIAPRLADRLARMGISFAPTELMDVISSLAQHPNAMG